MTNRDLIPMTSTLTGFTGDAITPVGITTLPMTFDDEPRTKTFMVVELPSTSQSAGPGEVRSDLRESKRCYLAITAIPKRGKKETPIPDP
ncbi:hypothetical protein BHM03_00049055 [Ensete ventricosum]|nr:hypothetical protein BHM03_00049055 [Ensete ventricosum]